MPRERAVILVFHASAELYGSDRTVLQLVEHLPADRFAFVVALPRDGPLVAKLEAAGARVEIGPLAIFGRASLTPSGFVSALRAWRASNAWARELVQRHAPDVIHTNTLIVQSGARAAIEEHVPHLWHLHEILERPRRLARVLARRVERSSVSVVHNSHATSEHWFELAPELRRKSRVVTNGVAGFEPRAETADRRAARRSLGLDPDAQWIALVGRINAWKGHGLLLGALARLRESRPLARIVFAGDAPPGGDDFVAQLERRIDESGLRDRVRRLEFQRDVEIVFAAADVIAVPSILPEPFGLVAAEAMSLARPVVAARHGGLAEIVEHGRTGLLFEPRDEEALAGALYELLLDPERAAQMGLAGRARQRELFSVERYAASFGALYGELIARPSELRVAS